MPDQGPLLTPQPQELEELIRGLHAEATPWCPAGLGHHAHWGPPLQRPCAAVSTVHLNRVRDHAVGDFTVTVEAGLSLGALQQTLAAADQWLPVDPPWPATAASAASSPGVSAAACAIATWACGTS